MEQFKSLNINDSLTLSKLHENLKIRSKTFIGYPCNNVFNYEELYPFLNFSINNIGDPFQESSYLINTRDIEKEVIMFFCHLMKLPLNKSWGYVTNGGTESNMYGLYLARELYPKSIVYYSQESHYSAKKIVNVLGIESREISTLANGEINYSELEQEIVKNSHRPVIIFANIGTTMKGAIDDIHTIKKILDGHAIVDRYIHCDSALSGMILPFVNNPKPHNFQDGIDSLSISGHKMIGSPFPSGILLAKKNNVDKIARSIEYIGTMDTTLSGSRNAFGPLVFWYAIKKHGYSGLKKIIHECFTMADYAISSLKDIGVEAWRNENSVTVVFPRPNDKILEKWQLAVEKNSAHLITVPHVSKEIIDEFVFDMKVFSRSRVHA